MPVALSLLLVIFFLAMNAFFVVSEFAMVRVRKSQIELSLEEGKAGARNALVIAENVNAYLSACQLGITIASLALGWLGEPAVAQIIRPLFAPLGLTESVISAVAVAIGFALITTLHIVVGELIPKSLAIFSTERYARGTATILVWFYRVTYPIMWLFNSITNGVVRLMGHDPANEHEVYTDEEIMLLIDESTESGLISSDQNEYVDNIFDISDKDAEAIMTPRTDIVAIDLHEPLEESMRLVRKYKFTRYPVYEDTKDRITGFVHVKDLYLLPADATVLDLRLREILAVPEGIPVAKLLQTMQRECTKIAVVVDEHGGTAGIVTMSDIMEQIVGRIDDEYRHSTQEEVVLQDDGSYVVDGLLPVADMVELMGFEPKEALEVETAGGLLMNLLDRIPQEGESIVVEEPLHGDMEHGSNGGYGTHGAHGTHGGRGGLGSWSERGADHHGDLDDDSVLRKQPRNATLTVLEMDGRRIAKIHFVSNVLPDEEIGEWPEGSER